MAVVGARVAVVTGATQGLGLALVAGLAQRWATGDVVYLTGRDHGHVTAAARGLGPTPATVRAALLDVAEPDAAEALAAELVNRHGGVDVLVGNAVMRVGPTDDPSAVVDRYAEVNNFGTTRCLRAFAPLLRDGGRLLVVASSLGTLCHLAPVLWDRFDGLPDLDEVDRQVARWRDEVRSGRARGTAWPGFVNIPSKVGQVAAVRALAAQRADADAARGILLAAVCPGMMNTPTSSRWWDVADAPSPDEAAAHVLDLIDGPTDPGHYGQLVRHGAVLDWKPA